MSANSRMATAVHALCVLARSGPEGATATVVARSLATNPVVVRRMLKDLAHGGLVIVRPGREGGARLARPAEEITLAAIHHAVGGGLFAARAGGNPRCPVQQTVPGLLQPIFAAADDAVSRTLAGTTLAALSQQIPPRAAQ